LSASSAIVLLTPRQQEALRLLALGHTNREIAARMCVEPHTVANHLNAVYRALEVPNRVAAAMAWHRYQRSGGGRR